MISIRLGGGPGLEYRVRIRRSTKVFLNVDSYFNGRLEFIPRVGISEHAICSRFVVTHVMIV